VVTDGVGAAPSLDDGAYEPWPADPYPGYVDETEPHRPWQPVDVGPVLDGSYERPQPTVGARVDGVGMFYPGRQHTIASESEGGKTWLVLAQTVVELDGGNGVVFVDFEDDESGVVGRLLALGAKRDAIRDRFAYLRPEEPISGLGNRGDLEQALGDLRPTLALLDGVTEAMVLHGLNPLDNKDTATFGRLVPRVIAESGPATVCLDHVTKSPDGRGRYALGAVHKLNGLNGAAYLLDNRVPFGVGIVGRSTVLIAKDRPGQLRRHAVRTGERHWFADLVLTSHDETFVEAEVEPPVEQGDEFRPTVYMQRISDAMVKAGRPLNKTELEDRVSGKAQTKRLALATLVDEGYVSVQKEPTHGALLHTLVRPFGGTE
jgi:hypothetical protein